MCLWLCTASVHNTPQNSSGNLPSYLQTNIIAQILSTGGVGVPKSYKLVVSGVYRVCANSDEEVPITLSTNESSLQVYPFQYCLTIMHAMREIKLSNRQECKLTYVDVIVRNRSWPAVSQICSFTFSPSTSTVLILKSTPIVVMKLADTITAVQTLHCIIKYRQNIHRQHKLVTYH